MWSGTPGLDLFNLPSSFPFPFLSLWLCTLAEVITIPLWLKPTTGDHETVIHSEIILIGPSGYLNLRKLLSELRVGESQPFLLLLSHTNCGTGNRMGTAAEYGTRNWKERKRKSQPQDLFRSWKPEIIRPQEEFSRILFNRKHTKGENKTGNGYGETRQPATAAPA